MPEPRGPMMGGPGRRGPGGPHGPVLQKEKPKDTKGTIKRLLSYIGANWMILLALLAIMLLVTLLGLAAPSLQGFAINGIIQGNDTMESGLLSTGKTGWQYMAEMLVLLGIVYLLNSVMTLFQGFLAAQLSQTTVRNMRNDLFRKIEKLPIRYIDTHPHGDIMSRMTNDVENISNTVSQSIASLISSVLTIVGTLFIMICYNPWLTLVALVSVPLSLTASAQMGKRMRKYFLKKQVLLGELNGQVEEMVTGYKTVMAFGREKQAIQNFAKTSSELRTCWIRAEIFGGGMGPLMNVIGNFGYLLIAVFGGLLAFHGAIAVGTIQAFLLYTKQFNRPISEVANQYTQILTALAGAERVFEIMDTADEVDEGQVALQSEQIVGDLSFRNLDFSYIPGQQVLKKFQMEVARGEKIAIVGATGSGKTTVVNLLTRFYDVDAGEILLDGVDVRDITKKTLRENIAIVLQDTVLFSDTIANNIRYGRLDATEEQVRHAARVANAAEFIERLPDGYNTVLSEAGSNLSGGQRQLLAIARAVLADPKILILDEATSSVDTRTELNIQKAMVALMKNRTSLIIAHRLSTIRDADQIVVIDAGRVVETGDHDSLLAQKGHYYRLYQNQYVGIKT